MEEFDRLKHRIRSLENEKADLKLRLDAADIDGVDDVDASENLHRVLKLLAHASSELAELSNDSVVLTTDDLRTAAESIPDQNPLVRFALSGNAKLTIVPTLSGENDYSSIEALRSELLASQGPIQKLEERYATNPNVPQVSLFGPLMSKYAEELSKPLEDINYTVLYARGSRIYGARRRAAQQIVSGEWPELDAEENEAIDAICDLHGPLIMASAVGRKLIEDAHQYEVPPDVYERDQKTIDEFGQILANETDLLEPEAAEVYRELTAKIDEDPQPTRRRGLGIAATGSALTVIVGGAVWYSAGGVAATVAVPAAAIGAAGLLGGFVWEAIKTMPRFKRASNATGRLLEDAIDKAEWHSDEKEKALLSSMAELTERKGTIFWQVASLRPEFGWAKKFLNATDQIEPTINDSEPAQSVENAQRIAVPKGTVFEAFRALELIADQPSDFDYSSGFLQDNIPNNTRQDLSNLGILGSTRGRFLDRVQFFGSASIKEVLLYAVSKTSWFSFAASYLESNGIRTPSKSFGKALSEEFDLGWAKSSEKRNGQNVKKWVVVLSPMFSDLKKDHPDYFIAQTIKSESIGKGAIPIFTVEFAEEIEFQKLMGNSYIKTLSHYGTSPPSYTNWKSKNPDKMIAALKAARQRKDGLR